MKQGQVTSEFRTNLLACYHRRVARVSVIITLTVPLCLCLWHLNRSEENEIVVVDDD